MHYCVFVVCSYQLVLSKQLMRHLNKAYLIRQEVKEIKGVYKNKTTIRQHFITDFVKKKY